MNDIAGHMGITHIDRGSLEYLISEHGCSSFLDVGCGPGGQVKEAKTLGMKALGIDRDPSVLFENCLNCDFHQCPVLLPFKFDVVWSVEVAEHIDEDKSDNFLRSCVENCSNIFILTASNNPRPALHVNCQARDYWIERVVSMGMKLRSDIYAEILKRSTMKREFLIENGMVFSWS